MHRKHGMLPSKEPIFACECLLFFRCPRLRIRGFRVCTGASRATSFIISAAVIWYTVLFRQNRTDRPVPLVVSVNDSYLPDWQNSEYKGGSHGVAVLGYNNSNSTYTYYETCGSGAAACETSGYGTYTISQSHLYNAIENDNGNGALIW